MFLYLSFKNKFLNIPGRVYLLSVKKKKTTERKKKEKEKLTTF